MIKGVKVTDKFKPSPYPNFKVTDKFMSHLNEYNCSDQGHQQPVTHKYELNCVDTFLRKVKLSAEYICTKCFLQDGP